MSNRLILSTSIALIVSAALAGMVLATPSTGVASTTIAAGNLDEINLNVKTGDWKIDLRTKGQTDVSVVENRVAPGGTFGWHSHPGPSLVIVKSGTSTFYSGDDPDCTPHRYPAGTAYVDPGGAVHIARNEGLDDLVVVVMRLIPAGATPRIDEPAPGNCPF